jgi:hypothetical protein
MCDRGDRTAEFVGIQEVDGTIDGRTGELIMASAGRHNGVRSTGTWTVVAGPGKGELAGIVGHGTCRAGPGSEATLELTYELP